MKPELTGIFLFAIAVIFILTMDEIVSEQTLPDGTRYCIGGRKRDRNLLQ
jgi:hypothetical protein